MQFNSLKGFNIGDLNVKLPIIQEGMGVGVSLSGLAPAQMGIARPRLFPLKFG